MQQSRGTISKQQITRNKGKVERLALDVPASFIIDKSSVAGDKMSPAHLVRPFSLSRLVACASVCQRVPACASVCQRVPALGHAWLHNALATRYLTLPASD